MPLQDTFELGAMFMWVTKSKLEFGLKAMRKWGYLYRDLFVWLKINGQDNLAPAVGKYLDHNTELLLLGIKGRVEDFPVPVMMGRISDVIATARETK